MNIFYILDRLDIAVLIFEPGTLPLITWFTRIATNFKGFTVFVCIGLRAVVSQGVSENHHIWSGRGGGCELHLRSSPF
uniref:Uncharacterized protein n=1 Tax=Anguilla anguilla TaxID=7936 RepID=A0A0E9S7B1_ANGAN